MFSLHGLQEQLISHIFLFRFYFKKWFPQEGVPRKEVLIEYVILCITLIRYQPSFYQIYRMSYTWNKKLAVKKTLIKFCFIDNQNRHNLKQRTRALKLGS